MTTDDGAMIIAMPIRLIPSSPVQIPIIPNPVFTRGKPTRFIAP
jgi:hypothetical protein